MNVILLIVGILNIALLIVLIFLTWKDIDESLSSEGIRNIYRQEYQDVKRELIVQRQNLDDLTIKFNKVLENSNIVIDQYGTVRYKDQDSTDDDSKTINYTVIGGH